MISTPATDALFSNKVIFKSTPIDRFIRVRYESFAYRPTVKVAHVMNFSIPDEFFDIRSCKIEKTTERSIKLSHDHQTNGLSAKHTLQIVDGLKTSMNTVLMEYTLKSNSEHVVIRWYQNNDREDLYTFEATIGDVKLNAGPEHHDNVKKFFQMFKETHYQSYKLGTYNVLS